jgi:hypothetical protein
MANVAVDEDETMAIEVDIPDCIQENGKYMSGKRHVRNDKMPWIASWRLPT